MNGSCQCGAVTFQTPTPEPGNIYICHCLECQRQSSSAFGISATFPYFKLAPAPGLPLGCYTRTTATGTKLNSYFCQKCGSRILDVDAEDEKVAEGYVCVKGGCLEGLGKGKLDLKNVTHFWCKRAVVEIPKGAKRYEEQPEG